MAVAIGREREREEKTFLLSLPFFDLSLAAHFDLLLPLSLSFVNSKRNQREERDLFIFPSAPPIPSSPVSLFFFEKCVAVAVAAGSFFFVVVLLQKKTF